MSATVILARALLFIPRHASLNVGNAQINVHRDALLSIPGVRPHDW